MEHSYGSSDTNDGKTDGGSTQKDEVLQTAGNSVQERTKCGTCLKDNLFLWVTFIGIAIGFVVGLTVRLADPGPDALMWIGMPGELYMRILKAIILPLIVCSVIDGTASTDPKSNGRIGIVSLAYILLTNALGGIIGLVLSVVVKPGSISSSDESKAQVDTRNLLTVDIFADFIRNVFPDNVIGAALNVAQTKYTEKDIVTQVNLSGILINVTNTELSKSVGTASGTNILGLIVISASLGIAASQAGHKAHPFISFFHSGAVVIFKLFDYIKWTTPLGAASLIARSLAGIDDLSSTLATMGVFVLVVGGGNLAYQLLVMTLMYFLFTLKNPFKFLFSVVKPWMIAFGPASAAVAIPEMIRISHDSYGIDPRVSGLAIPLSLTLNRDGSCLFISATCLFMAQYAGLDLDAGRVLTVGVLSILSSLAIPSVPSASVVSVLIILESVGIPSNSVGLVLAVEWLTDRIRTTSNVVSNMVCVNVTWRLCQNNLRLKDLETADIRTSEEINVQTPL